MAQARTGLLRRREESAGKSCRVNEIGGPLVFREADDQCAHNRNEISALGAELVFRDVPG
jgi:hypothetical protein